MKNYLKYWKISFSRPFASAASVAFKVSAVLLALLAAVFARIIASTKYWLELIPQIAGILLSIVVGCAALYAWWCIILYLYRLS